MDTNRFDQHVRAPARRRLLRGFAAGAALLGLVSGGATAKTKKRKKRGATVEGPCGNGRVEDNRCRRHSQCCTGFCDRSKGRGKDGRCRCRKLGRSCVEDRNCCAPAGQPLTCQSGTCQTAPSCMPVGGACAATADCCAGLTCANGACQTIVDHSQTLMAAGCSRKADGTWHCDNVVLAGADLSGASLVNASLVSADLTAATLAGADLTNATLVEADLTRATLTDARLAGALLDGARLVDADLSRSDLAKSRLVNADLTAARLVDARLTAANLAGADLAAADLARALAVNANLTSAVLVEANVVDVDFSGAVLVDADFGGADVTGAIWSDTLCPANINSDQNGGTCCGAWSEEGVPFAGCETA